MSAGFVLLSAAPRVFTLCPFGVKDLLPSPVTLRRPAFLPLNSGQATKFCFFTFSLRKQIWRGNEKSCSAAIARLTPDLNLNASEHLIPLFSYVLVLLLIMESFSVSEKMSEIV